MLYIDSGSRDPAQALGTWLSAELDDGISELRIQSGFYSDEALPPFRATFTALAAENRLARVVVGSNDGGTLRSHLDELVNAIGIPRQGAELGIVYFSGAYYHPKTYHIRRVDGSQAGYVGSANFTLSGLAARHVEAGVIFDTRNGDPADVLGAIADATDAWFSDDRPGFEPVTGPLDVQRLLESGIVRTEAPPRPPRPAGQGGQPPQRPSLQQLVFFSPPEVPLGIPAPVAWQPLPSVQRTPPYPPYVFFAPDLLQPTFGDEALTGTTLGGATGLIVRLSRDNDRHWREAPGTANVSIPVSTAATLRFGLYGDRARPRAEFDLAIRYVDNEVTLIAPIDRTGIMSFGFTPGDTGHADLRLVLPRPPIANLRQRLMEQNRRLPQALDFAILEWPRPALPTFRMTVTNPGSSLGVAISQIWQRAATDGRLASRGACWLPAGVSPNW